MSGISSRQGKWGVAKQSVKGTPASAPTHVFFEAGTPSLMLQKERNRYPMTDVGRDQGPAYTSAMYVSGDVPLYAHFDGFATLAYLALGANGDAGGGPNYTHTATPANDLPWFTCWRSVGGVIFERFIDCKLGALQIESSAGQPLLVTLSIVGCTAEFQASEMAGTAKTSQPYVYPEFCGQLKIDTISQKLHRLSMGIDNAVSGYQADCLTYDDVDPGARTVTLSFATRFTGATAFPDYRTFFYGSSVGTTPSIVVGTHAFSAEAIRDANTSIKFDFPQITYAPFSPQPDPGGAPLEIEVVCEVEKPVGNITTWTTKDQTATV